MYDFSSPNPSLFFQITLKVDRVRETIFSFLQLNEDFYSAKKNPDHIEVKDLSSFSYNSQQK